MNQRHDPGGNEATRQVEHHVSEVTHHGGGKQEEPPQFWQSSSTQQQYVPTVGPETHLSYVSGLSAAEPQDAGDGADRTGESPVPRQSRPPLVTLLLAGAVVALAAVIVTFYFVRAGSDAQPSAAPRAGGVSSSGESKSAQSTPSSTSPKSAGSESSSASESSSDAPQAPDQSSNGDSPTSVVTTTVPGQAAVAPPSNDSAPDTPQPSDPAQTSAPEPTSSTSTVEAPQRVVWPGSTTSSCGRGDEAGSLSSNEVRLSTARSTTSCAFANQAGSKVQSVVQSNADTTSFEVTQYSAYRASLGTYDDPEIRLFCNRSNHLSHCVSRESVNANAGVDMYVADPGMG